MKVWEGCDHILARESNPALTVLRIIFAKNLPQINPLVLLRSATQPVSISSLIPQWHTTCGSILWLFALEGLLLPKTAPPQKKEGPFVPHHYRLDPTQVQSWPHTQFELQGSNVVDAYNGQTNRQNSRHSHSIVYSRHI